MEEPDTHYLKRELYELVRNDPAVFDFLQDGSLDGMWYWDLESPEDEWMSARFWETLGVDPSTRTHKAAEWQDLIDPDDLKVAIDNFEKHCADPDHPYDQIVRYNHADGSSVWVRCRGIAIRDETGKPVRLLGAHTDVTELVLARARLSERDLEERFRSLIEALPAGVLLVSPTGRIELVNRELERMFGYDREELLGQSLEMLVPEDLRSGHAKLRDGFFGAPSARPMGAGRDLRGRRKDGSEIPIEIALNPIETDQGRHVIASVADIGGRRQAELDRARLAAIVESSDDAIISTDLEGRITSWNRGAGSLYGYSAEEAVGLSIRVIVPDDREHEVDRLLQMAGEKGNVHNFETVRRRKGGESVHVSLTVSPLLDTEGRVIGKSVIARDVSEHRHRADEMRRRTEELARSHRDLEQFTSLASHDLQEPLRKVISFGERIIARYGDRLDDQGRDYLARMQGAALRMRDMIDGLLQLSRVAGESDPGVSTDLNEVLTHVRSDLGLDTEDIRVEVGELPTVAARPSHMGQLVQNLLSNAVRYRDPGRVLEISVTAEEAEEDGIGPVWKITFQDNGLGFENQYAERIFGAFRRLQPRTEGHGSGLGLAICRRIAEEYGGSITAQAEPGEGARFVLLLPRSPV